MFLLRQGLRYASALTGMMVLFLCWSLAFAVSNAVLNGLCRALFVSTDPYIVLGTSLAVIFWFYAGIMVGRFLIRFSPAHYSVASKQISYHSTPIFLVVLGAALLLVNYPMMLGDLGLGTFVVAGACDLAILGILYVRYANGPSVGSSSALFLRRFSSFADRSLLAACLRSIPGSMTPVLLVQRDEPLRNWDPFLLAWAGLKLKDPFARVPNYLECSDEEWMSCVGDLVGKACLIMIDVSEVSESIRAEIHLLKVSGALERTVVLSKMQSPAGIGAVSSKYQVTYQMNRGVGRYFLALLLSFGTAYTLWLKVQETLNISSSLDRFVLIIAVVLTLTYSFALFAKQGVTGASVRVIENSVLSVFFEQLSKLRTNMHHA